MSFDTERLYDLLPAVYRTRDAEQGEPLKALLAVITGQVAVLEENLAQLYDDQFIETCAEWVVPYIGDLIGARLLHPLSATAFSQRAQVANTLAYRRRKGTAAVLEQLARDATGWPARVVEFFQLLATTQYMNHLRLDNHYAPDLRRHELLERLNTPFDRIAHTAEVRRIASQRGKYNIPNVGIFLWRLRPYPVTRGTARALTDPADGRYTFSPLGIDIPLFNRPQIETEITHLAEETNVPGRLRRRALYDDLEAYRHALIAGDGPPATSYFGDSPVLEVVLDGSADPVLPEEIAICNLDGWDDPTWSPPPSQSFTRASDGSTFQTRVAVDPELGRLALLDGVALPDKVLLNYVYGFSSDMGGGPYNRRDTLADPQQATLFIPVAKGTNVATLQEALQQWSNAGKPSCIIQIQDNGVYGGNLDITLPDGGWLVIEAADGVCPSVRTVGVSTLKVDGTAEAALTLNGLWIEGGLELEGDLELTISHCTLVPGRCLNRDGTPAFPDYDSLHPGENAGLLKVSISHSITGPLRLPAESHSLAIRDSIIDAPPVGGSRRPAIAADDSGTQPGPPTILERVTILGPVTVEELTLASEVIFTEPVVAARRQVGCVRFSFVPLDSQVPRRYRCQPESKDDVARVRLQFTALRYGDPSYCQLGRRCALEIRQGAEDSSEMGAFNSLKQPQREANLRAALDEYLRFGLEAGIFCVT